MAQFHRNFYGVGAAWRRCQCYYGQLNAVHQPFNEAIHLSIVFFCSLLQQPNIITYGKERDWEYENNEFTDQSIIKIILDSVRARLLDFLHNEVPYKLQCEMEYLETDNGKSVSHT